MTWIEICFVLVCLLESTMTSFDDRVKEISKDIVRLFISSNHADCHDEGVAWIVNTSLDSSVEGEAIGSLQWS